MPKVLNPRGIPQKPKKDRIHVLSSKDGKQFYEGDTITAADVGGQANLDDLIARGFVEA
jgi:hypothetical protein